MAENTIFVKARNPERVALWERDDRHPGGEVYVSGKNVVEVFETAMVRSKLRTREIEQTSGPAFTEGPAPLTDENRPILATTAAPNAPTSDLTTDTKQPESGGGGRQEQERAAQTTPESKPDDGKASARSVRK